MLLLFACFCFFYRDDMVIATLDTCYHYSLYLMRCMTATSWNWCYSRCLLSHSSVMSGLKFTSIQFRTLQFQFQFYGCHWALESYWCSNTRQLIDALNTTSTFQQKWQKYQSSMNVCAIQSQTENFCFNSFPNHQTTLFQLFRRQIYTTNTMVYDWKHTRCTLHSVFIVLSEHALAFQLIKWKMWSHCHRCTLTCTLFSFFRFCSISYK